MDPLADLKSLLPQCLLYDQVRIGSRLAVLLRQGVDLSGRRREIENLRDRAVNSAQLRASRQTQRPRPTYPELLPVSQRRDEIIAALQKHSVLVIAGETGSGKTTQIPKMCLEAGLGDLGRIGCTQPRRVAALSISRRVAEELHVPWGKQVGCKIRFDDDTSPETIVKFMTDGILLAEVQGDPNLTEYEVIVVDEAHERSLNIDFLLGHLRQLVERRPDLKLIITSATIDTARFSAAFGNAPVIEVSGRVYPVEVRYAPINPMEEESGDQTFIDAAATAIEDILTSSSTGDVLTFLPGERDIRELKDLLITRGVYGVDVIPLFGRLSGSDQQRAFQPSTLRKIVLATNIAETSITLPGVRFVIDSGMARISRYNPRTRVKRLPVEPVSQSSANQRKGRAGRVAQGICIRLYSEEDYQSRPEFTQPEIQRANLAEVILRMKAAGLGEIETFPFLEPPTPAAIRGGYDLLRELGALDDQRQLTPLGQDLARLPVDPTIGRIVLQSSKENVLEDVLIISAGLSIQDPRERPFEAAAAASNAHRQFQHSASDFLTLLNLWHKFHEQWEKLRTQNQLRRFCKANYLSYMRMREWGEIHAQLSATFHAAIGSRWSDADEDDAEDSSQAPGTTGPTGTQTNNLTLQDPRYCAIHRSILSGFLGHCAQKLERNLYKASGNRQLAVFPGSTLHHKPNPQPAAVKHPKGPETGVSKSTGSQPEWIVAGEVVETSRLFARTLAAIDPGWIAELGAHLCKKTYDHPRWDPGAGQVVARERITFHGLEVSTRNAAYGPIAPTEAAEIFIRSALVEEGLRDEPQDETEDTRGPGRSQRKGRPMPVRRRWQIHSEAFFEHNRKIIERVQVWKTRVRKASLQNLDDMLFKFYQAQLPPISSVAELNDLLRSTLPGNPGFLQLSEKDLVGEQDLSFDAAAFPEQVTVSGHSVSVEYAYAPGEDHDGPTFKVPLGLLPALNDATVAWLLPGLREEAILCLLRELPKGLRRDLQPFAPKVKEIASEFVPQGGRFLDELAAFVTRKYQVSVPPGTWVAEHLPNHLRPRVELIGPDKKIVHASRDLGVLEEKTRVIKPPPDTNILWQRARTKWERTSLTHWTLGTLPERIEERGSDGAILIAFPGLAVESNEVCLRLFPTTREAGENTRAGWMKLLEIPLSRDLAWMMKDLRSLERFKLLYSTLGNSDELMASAAEHLQRHLFPPPKVLSAANYEAALENARRELKTCVPGLVDRVGVILQKRQELLVWKKPYAGMREELDRLIPKRFLGRIPFEHLQHVPRYLKAMQLRAERASVNPIKDRERMALIAPFQAALDRLEARGPGLSESGTAFRWLLEEFKVSVFAQELGTAIPVSAKRLDSALILAQGTDANS